MEEEGKSPDAETSLDWRPTDESGRLMNFFDTFKATPDMRKVSFLFALVIDNLQYILETLGYAASAFCRFSTTQTS